jgi:hypothetical protein
VAVEKASAFVRTILEETFALFLRRTETGNEIGSYLLMGNYR